VFHIVGGRESFGQVEKLVPAEAAQRVRIANHLFQSSSDRDQQLIAREMTERVVDALEVVEVQEQHGAEASVAEHLGSSLIESIIEERAIGESGQRVVQGLVGELGRQRALVGDVTLRDDVVEDVALGVAGGRTQDFYIDEPPVFAQVSLHVA
jgi:hypothetical protein